MLCDEPRHGRIIEQYQHFHPQRRPRRFLGYFAAGAAGLLALAFFGALPSCDGSGHSIGFMTALTLDSRLTSARFRVSLPRCLSL